MPKISLALFGGSSVESYSAPAGTRWHLCLAGGDNLDLRNAEFPQHHTVRLNYVTLFGGSKIRVPKGTKVDLGGIVLFGGNRSKVDPAESETNNSISIRFYGLAGGISVDSD